MAGAQQGWRNSGGGGGGGGGLNYLGTWNAATNTPPIMSGVGGAAGDYYVVSVAGSTDVDGITDWEVGDWIIFNGSEWQKIDNTDQVISVNGLQGVVLLGLEQILSQSNTSGAFDISMDSGQGIVFNEGSGGILVSNATTASRTWALPDRSGVLATTLDTLYGGDGTVGTTRVATVTDTLTWSGGSTIQTTSSGSNTISRVVGVSPLTFSTFGDLNQMTTGGSFDTFSGTYDGGAEPAIQAQLYDNATFVENACLFIGIDDFSGTDRPYSSFYYTPDNVAFSGFQADIDGEQLYTQRGGVVTTALTSADRILFTNPTGYIKATTYADLIIQLGNNITDDVIPRGTGSSIENGTWNNVGNDIYPTTTGSNIGDATHRIGTIFMSSTLNHSTALNLDSGGTNYHSFETTGAVNLVKSGAGLVTIGTVAAPTQRLNVDSNMEVVSAAGNAQLLVSASGADSSIQFRDGGTTRTSLGWDSSTSLFRMGTTAIDSGIFYEYSPSLGQGRHAQSLGIGAAFPPTNTRVLIRSTGNTSATVGLVVQTSAGVQRLAVRDDGLIFINTTSTSTAFAGIPLSVNAFSVYNGTATVAGQANDVQYNPSANTTAFIRGTSNRAQKFGANNAGTIYSFSGESRQNGSGNVGSMAGAHGFFWSTGTGTTTNGFGFRSQSQIQSTGTVTNFGGIEVVFGQNAAGSTITNMIGVLVNTPTNTGGAVTNTYGLRLNNNTLGSTLNYGIYVEGSTRLNALEGNLIVGATTISANASQVEVTGDVELIAIGDGFIVKSPDGTRWKFTPDNAGAWTSVAV